MDPQILEKLREIIELEVKNIITPDVYKILRQTNVYFSRLYPGRVYPGRYNTVLGGGCVFGIYFKESKVDAFKTHDFDIKLVDTHADEPVRIGSPHYVTMLEHIDDIMTSIERYLNATKGTVIDKALEILSYRLNQNDARYKVDIRAVPFSIKGFKPDEEKGFQKMWGNSPDFNEDSFLCTLEFQVNIEIRDMVKRKIYNKRFTNSLIDMTPYADIPEQYEYFGEPSLDSVTEDQIRAQNRMSLNNFANVDALTSYFKNTILENIVTDQDQDGPLYYVSLGYLLWDTVRMINWSIITLDHPDPNERAKSRKLMRYLKKYHYLLRSFSDLKAYGNCKETAFKRFRNKCLEEE